MGAGACLISLEHSCSHRRSCAVCRHQCQPVVQACQALPIVLLVVHTCSGSHSSVPALAHSMQSRLWHRQHRRCRRWRPYGHTGHTRGHNPLNHITTPVTKMGICLVRECLVPLLNLNGGRLMMCTHNNTLGWPPRRLRGHISLMRPRFQVHFHHHQYLKHQ